MMAGTVRCACVAALVGALAAGRPRPVAAQRPAYEELQTFSGVLNHIRLNYLDTVGYGYLVRAAIEGVLSSLDPYSYYISADDVVRREAVGRGELGTVGITVVDVAGRPTVLGVAPEGPAQKRGVFPGDRILMVDDSAVADLDPDAVELRLVGEKGSKVALTLERGSPLDPVVYSVALSREPPEPRTVGLARIVGARTGYVKLFEFADGSTDELEERVRELRRAGATQFLLDLRDNPGGSLMAALDVASLFLPDGMLVFRTCGRKADVNREYRTSRNGPFRTLPLVVLVNGATASAAEALAAALQDHDRAPLVGRRTFGKALIQHAFLLPTGVAWLTTGLVVTPSGRTIQRADRALVVAESSHSAGRCAASGDTAAVFRTDAGRTLKAGGGVAPDVERAAGGGVDAPRWWTLALATELDTEVADSVAYTLDVADPARDAWIAEPAAWQPALLPPFVAKVSATFDMPISVDSSLAPGMVWHLAMRAARVRWGADAAERMRLDYDGDVRIALDVFGRMAEVLGQAK